MHAEDLRGYNGRIKGRFPLRRNRSHELVPSHAQAFKRETI